MRSSGLTFLALVLWVSAARADDGMAWAVIEQAIQAHGGEAALGKWPVVTVKTKGIFHGYEKTPVFFFTGETTTCGVDRYRSVIDGELNKEKFRIVNVLNGRQGWIQLAGEQKQETTVCSPAQIAEFQERGYEARICTLLPLRDRAFTLTLAGEQKVGEGPAIAIRVANKGRRDVTLFFDKETHLLVKTEARGTAGTGIEGKVETLLGQHKDFDGMKRPTTWAVYYNGRSLISDWLLDYEMSEQPKAGMFDRP